MEKSKRIISLLLALIIAAAVIPAGSISVAAAVSYNKTAALNYAAAHWAENSGDCAQFVSRCLAAGGIPASTSSSTTLYGFLNGTYGASQKLTITGGTSGNILQSDNTGKITAGDPVFFYCNTCGEFTHTSLCNGTDSSGYCVDYAWNNPHDGTRRITTWSHTDCGTNNWTIYSVHIGGTASPEPDLDTICDDFTKLLCAEFDDWELDVTASVGAGYLFADIDFDGVPEFITNYCDGSSYYSLNRYFKYSDKKVVEIYPEGPYEEGSLQGIDWCIEKLGTVRKNSKTYLAVTDSNGIYGANVYLLGYDKSEKCFSLTDYISYKSLNSSKPGSEYQYFYCADGKTAEPVTQKTYNQILSDTPDAGKTFINSKDFNKKSNADKTAALKKSFNAAWKYSDTATVPEEITLSKVENTSTGIKISWEEAMGASSYIVYRKAESESSWNTLSEVKTAYFTDISVSEGIKYTYTVKGKNSAGKSAAYNHVGLSTVRLKSPVLTLTAANGAITVKWKATAGALGYYIYRKAGSETSWTKIAKIKSDSTVSYSDKNVKSGTTYTYTIKSYGSAGTSYAASSVKMKYLAAPVLTLKNDAGKIVISWSKITGADSYTVYRKAGSETSWTKLKKITDASTLSFTDKSVKGGTDYTYTVKAGSGSTYSAVKSYKTKYLARPDVTLSNENGKIKISWNKISGAKGYYIYRKAGSETSWTKINTVNSGSTVSCYDKSVKGGTDYTYTVKAVNGKICSAVKSYKIKYLARPAVTLSNANGTVKISWNKISGAKEYCIYRKAGSETSWTKINTVKDGSTVSCYDKSVKSGTTYTYTVKAVNGSYKSAVASSVKIKYLSAGKIVTAKPYSAAIKITWEKVKGASGYYVYRKTGSSSWSKIATVKDGSTLVYIDGTAKKGTTYTYCVRPYSGGDKGTHTADASCKR